MSKHHNGDGKERWRVDLDVAREGDDTIALAELYVGNAIYEAHGHAHQESFTPTVADELAVARALFGLAHQLVDSASREVDRASRAVAGYADEAEVVATELGTMEAATTAPARG